MFPLFHSRQKANLPEVPSLSGSSAPLGCRSLRVVPTPEPAPAGLAPGPPGALSGPPMASVSLGPAVCSHHTHLPPPPAPWPLATGDRRLPGAPDTSRSGVPGCSLLGAQPASVLLLSHPRSLPR